MSDLSKATGVNINAFKWVVNQVAGSASGPAIYASLDALLEGQNVDSVLEQDAVDILEQHVSPTVATAIIAAAGKYATAIAAGDTVPVALTEVARYILDTADPSEATVIDGVADALEAAEKVI